MRILAMTLRVAAFLIGLGITVVGFPIVIMGASMPRDTVPALDPLLTMLLALGVLVSGYFFIAFHGDRMRESLRSRVIAAVLLLPSLGLGASQLLGTGHPEMRKMGWLFFVPAAVLLLATVWPWRLASSPAIAAADNGQPG